MHLGRKLNYFILAGSSGTGKSTVLKKMQEKGFKCFPEAARAVLEEQLAIQGPALPSNNPYLFVQKIQKLNVNAYEAAKGIDLPIFFDRGLPDLVHYAIRFNVDPAEFDSTSKHHLYNKTVFFFLPWKEIFVNDSVRKMSFEKSIEFHELLVKTYKDLNYDLVEVPFVPAAARAQFLLDMVHKLF